MHTVTMSPSPAPAIDLSAFLAQHGDAVVQSIAEHFSLHREDCALVPERCSVSATAERTVIVFVLHKEGIYGAGVIVENSGSLGNIEYYEF